MTQPVWPSCVQLNPETEEVPMVHLRGGDPAPEER
ncbi:unnamed protein product [Knipowitschia caucasica]